MTALLHVDGVSRRFGGYLALNNASCEIGEGHIHALIGPNGAGKTTLFNVVSGLLRPTIGKVSFKGRDYTGLKPDRVLTMEDGRVTSIGPGGAANAGGGAPSDNSPPLGQEKPA